MIKNWRSHSTYNFVGNRIDGCEEAMALLTKEAAAAPVYTSENDWKDRRYLK